jgi:hypothetical protein
MIVEVIRLISFADTARDICVLGATSVPGGRV